MSRFCSRPRHVHPPSPSSVRQAPWLRLLCFPRPHALGIGCEYGRKSSTAEFLLLPATRICVHGLRCYAQSPAFEEAGDLLMSYLRVVFRGRPVAPPEMDLDAMWHARSEASEPQAGSAPGGVWCMSGVGDTSSTHSKQASTGQISQEKFRTTDCRKAVLDAMGPARPSRATSPPSSPASQNLGDRRRVRDLIRLSTELATEDS